MWWRYYGQNTNANGLSLEPNERMMLMQLISESLGSPGKDVEELWLDEAGKRLAEHRRHGAWNSGE